MKAFYLPLGTRVVHTIDLHPYTQSRTEVFEQHAGVGAAGVKHHHRGYTVKGVVFTSVLQSIDENTG